MFSLSTQATEFSGLDACSIATSTNFTNICQKKGDPQVQHKVKNQIIHLALTMDSDENLPKDLNSVSFNEKSDQQNMDNLSIELRAKYLARLEKLILHYFGLNKVQLVDLFNQVKSEIIKAAKRNGINEDVLMKTAKTAIFDFENLNPKNAPRILQACDKDGMGEQAIFLDKIDQNFYVLICPGELLKAAFASKYPLKILSFFIGHELGHSLDISKSGLAVFSDYLNCLEKNYSVEIKSNISKARELEQVKRSSTTKTLIDFAEKTSWIRYYDGVQKSIEEKNKEIGFSETFRITFYAYELTADIFGFFALANQLEKLNPSEKNIVVDDFVSYRVCGEEFISLTHPSSRLRTIIGFQSKLLIDAFRCESNHQEQNSCNWISQNDRSQKN